ncbi:50S ribosomal protein L25, partial [Xanthomonas vasicola pv. vasculorum]
MEYRPLLHPQSRSSACCWVACNRIYLREIQMFTINAEVR